MDGGSNDASVQVLTGFAKACAHTLQWKSEHDRGQSNALNKGFRQAQGEIIGWLNADDRYRPRAFSTVLQVFRAHPEVDVVYGDYTWINAQGETIQQRREIGFSGFVLLYHRVLYIPTTAMFFRRRIIDDGHLLDETLHFSMDFEFFVRLHLQGYQFLHHPAFFGDFRFQPASKTSLHPEKQIREQAQIMRRYSTILRHCPTGVLGACLTRGLRTAAAMRRYGEKAIRGYYLTQFRATAP